MWKAIVLVVFLSFLWFYQPFVGILLTVLIIVMGVLNDEARKHPVYLGSEIIGTIWAIFLGLIFYITYLARNLLRKFGKI
jgi:hypothetical protein